MSTSVRALVPFMAVAALAGASCSKSECSADSEGLEDATPVATRALPGIVADEGVCARPRLEVLSSEAELKQLYDEFQIGELPPVDFTKERVIVRVGMPTEAIQWTVAQGDLATVALRSCTLATDKDGCSVDVLAASALVARVESRRCDSVPCGRPIRPPRGGRR